MSHYHETFLTRLQQAKRWGVSKRSVERWGEDEHLSLPPEIEINGRRYRKLTDLEAWERARVVASTSKSSAERKCAVEGDTPLPAARTPAASLQPEHCTTTTTSETEAKPENSLSNSRVVAAPPGAQPGLISETSTRKINNVT
jgi:hypothetical protein